MKGKRVRRAAAAAASAPKMRSVEREALHLTSFCRVLTSTRPSRFLQCFYELRRPIKFDEHRSAVPAPPADAAPYARRTYLTHIRFQCPVVFVLDGRYYCCFTLSISMSYLLMTYLPTFIIIMSVDLPTYCEGDIFTC